MRFIHTADLHLGFNTFRGEKDYKPFKAFDFAVRYAIENRADLFLITGDVFDRRDPPSFIQKGFAEEIAKLVKNEITVFIVTGNHEGAPNPERNIHLDVYDALRINGVFIAKNIKLFNLPGANIISVPYPYKRNLLAKEEYKDKSEEEIAIEMNEIIVNRIKTLVSEVDNKFPVIIAAHVPIAEGKVGSEVYTTFTNEVPISLSQLDIKGISYVALGHLHTEQIFSTVHYGIPVVYPGSTDRLNFSEEQDKKGFFDVHMEKGGKPSFKFVQNPFSRKFYSIKINTDADLSKIDFKKAEESITRIVLYRDVENEKLLKELVKKLQNEALVFAGLKDKRNFNNESNFSHMHLSVEPIDAIKKYLNESKAKNKFIEKQNDRILETALDLLKEIKEKH